MRNRRVYIKMHGIVDKRKRYHKQYQRHHSQHHKHRTQIAVDIVNHTGIDRDLLYTGHFATGFMIRASESVAAYCGLTFTSISPLNGFTPKHLHEIFTGVLLPSGHSVVTRPIGHAQSIWR